MLLRKAVILAAGKGTRLMPFTNVIPKEMILVNKKPIIEHTIKLLFTCGIKDIAVITNFQKRAIIDHVALLQKTGFKISYFFQEKATGTAHAVYLVRKYVDDESFVVVYGDNYFESAVPIVQAVDFHVKKKAEATLLLHYLNKPYGSGLVKLDNDGRVLKIVEKPSIRESIMFKIKNKYIAISGLHILEPTVFQFIERTRPGRNGETWLTDSIELMREDGHSVYGILSRVRVWDIGTPEIMRKIQTSIA